MTEDDKRAILTAAKAFQSPPARKKKRTGGKTVNFAKAYDRNWNSLSMSVHPTQAAEFNAQVKADGNPAFEYKPDGTATATSKTGRDRELRRRGMADLD